MPTPSNTPLGRLELRCPPLPHTLIEALNLVDHPERIEVRTVTAMLERDPLVVARLLQTVNSAYYGLHRTVSSTERAVVMLGPVAVVGIVVGMSMLRLRSILDGPAGACFTRLILHSVATAYLTEFLTDELPEEAPGLRLRRRGPGFSAGLLHDFGKIILVYNFPEEAVALYDKRALNSHVEAEDLRDMESLLFGSDHTEAGEFAALKLHFPEALTRVIRHHHEPERAKGDAETLHLVHATAVANLAAQALGHGFTGTATWDDLHAATAWERFLERTPHTSESLTDALLGKQEELDSYVESFAEAQSGKSAS